MKGDFSRLTWDRRKHYSAVLMQQGRLQLDADWNEQIDIVMHRLETEVADYVGHSGVPAGSKFAFQVAFGTDPSAPADQVQLAAGRIYVQGRLVENDAPVALTLSEAAPDLPTSGPARAVVYLDSWERLLTFVDDPAIREVALGGPDTATRRQTAWAARAELLAADTQAAALAYPWQPATPALSSGLLNARLSTDLPSLENQLYRVEVYSADAATVQFTWSRDNACVSAIVTEMQAASRSLRISGGGRDTESALAERQWAELLTRAQQDAGARGAVVQLDHVDADVVVITEQSWPWTDPVPAISVVRRWDGPTGVSTATIVPANSDPAQGWVPLENGIEVRFEGGPDGAGYVPGDYWLIASRTATAVIEWPVDESGGPIAQRAAGVEHRYAALALVERDDQGHWSVPAGGDLRVLVSPLDDGFVTRGTAGATMRGPLTVQPLLAAGQDGESLIAVLIDPAFDDAGHGGNRHVALQVNGTTELGTEQNPVSTTAYGYFNVLGTSYSRRLNVSGPATLGALSVSGLDTEGKPLPQWALRLGEVNPIGIDLPVPVGAASSATDAATAAAAAAAAKLAESTAAAAATAAAAKASAAAADAAAANAAYASAAQAAQNAAASAVAASNDAALKAATAALGGAAGTAAATAARVAASTASSLAASLGAAANAAADKANAANSAAAAASAAANEAATVAANAKASAADGSAAAAAAAASAAAAAAASGSDVGFLRFGNGSGKRFHIARGRETADAAADNVGTVGALVTFVDNGYVGIGTTTPAAGLHISNRRGGGMQTIALTSTTDLTLMAAILRQASTPDNTLFIGGVYSDTVQLFWKTAGGVLYAASLPATDQLTNQLRGS